MGNGTNEPIQFTRGDATRIERINNKQDELHGKIDNIIERLNEFHDAHKILKNTVDKNSGFRRIFTRITLYILSPSSVIVIVARAFGWF